MSKTKNSIILIVVILVLFLIICACKGFPWEHIIATSRAKKYVTEKYQFTPTKAKYYLSIVDGPQRVLLYNDEFDFSFSVSVGRILPINKMSDDYLERLTEYYMARDLNDYIKKKTNNKGKAIISSSFGRIHDFTLSELEENTQIAFEKLQEKYGCIISLNTNMIKNNYNINYDLMYDIYNNVFITGLNPRNISFFYNDKKGKTILYVSIDKKHFFDINSPDDLKSFFEEAIKNTNKK